MVQLGLLELVVVFESAEFLVQNLYLYLLFHQLPLETFGVGLVVPVFKQLYFVGGVLFEKGAFYLLDSRLDLNFNFQLLGPELLVQVVHLLSVQFGFLQNYVQIIANGLFVDTEISLRAATQAQNPVNLWIVDALVAFGIHNYAEDILVAD